MFSTGTATDYIDLLDRLDTFLTAKGSAYGLAYSGTGNGLLTGLSGGADSVAETFTLTATSSTSFDVVGSLAGSIGPATVGTPFAHAKLEFLISDGSTDFEAGDAFTLSTAPKWTSLRRALGCRVTATQVNTGQYAAQNLVDGKSASDATRGWQVSSPITIPQDVELEFFTAETIASYQIAAFTASAGNAPSAWTLDYWDGDEWVTLDTRSSQTFTEHEVKTFTISSPVSATIYRLHITTIPFTNLLVLGAVRLLQSTGVDAAFSQMIWQAPGNDGDSEILCGVHAFEREDADYFNWELAAFDGFQAASLFYAQAGAQTKLYLPLWDDVIPYWFVADGRRVVIIAKVGAQYETAIMGLLDPYFSPEQLPYPMALGGSLALGGSPPTWQSTNFRFSNSTSAHRAFTHADTQGETPPNLTAEDSQMRVRGLDGVWAPYEGTNNDGVGAPASYKHLILPYRCGLAQLDPNRDGSYALWPVMLCHSAPNTWGQLPGVSCITGQGITAETLVRRGAVDWIVLPNISRTDRNDFLAIALD